ncbi:dephospho-CoA kinase [Candidatus Woesearchaeota archaeon]|nr:dephospho-CoA kinase [Candidatus Woesearchaeota archaeon]
MIIALTGTIGSGKGEVAKYVEQKGFQYLVYSDVLREIAKQKGIEPTRQNLHKLGGAIKEKVHDPGYLSKQLLKKITKEHAVVDGVRNVGEIEELKKSGDAYIIGITAPQRLRFLRLRKRKREGDPLTFPEFKRIDNIENRGRTKGQEINACLKHADYMIANNKGVRELHQKVDEILRSIAQKRQA